MLSQLFRLLPSFLRRRLERLRFPQLAVVTGLLFLITLFLPDPLPFVDELLLLAGSLLLGSWKQHRETRAPSAEKPPIEGESRRVDTR
jgi:hypothetical protein